MIYYCAIYDILLFYLIGMETSGGGFGGIVRQLYRFYPLDVRYATHAERPLMLMCLRHALGNTAGRIGIF